MLAFYAYKDIEKLEKFMTGKPVAEYEIGMALLQEMVAYAETSISRRKFILHYFGESYDERVDDQKMDDNIRYPKSKSEAKDELTLLLKAIGGTREKFKAKEVVKTLIGEQNAIMISHHTAELSIYGQGKHKTEAYWMALIRQANVAGYLKKDIETYGVIKITSQGEDFSRLTSFLLMTEDHTYKDRPKPTISAQKDVVNDSALKRLLIKLRKEVADQNEVPPYTVFKKIQSMI